MWKELITSAMSMLVIDLVKVSMSVWSNFVRVYEPRTSYVSFIFSNIVGYDIRRVMAFSISLVPPIRSPSITQ